VHEADQRRVIENYYESLDTPVSLACYMLYVYNEHDQLVSKDLNPSQYIDYDLFRRDLAAISFLRKADFVRTSFDRKKRALDSFWESEATCRETNRRIRSYLSGKLLSPNEWVLNATIRKIDKILGSFCIDSVLDNAKWGPGVTQTVKGCDTSGATKFDIDRDITADSYALFGPVLNAAYPLWEPALDAKISQGCVVLTVPKNAKTDRTIAVEPGLNSWIQLGIGKSIRKRLGRAGYNLDSDLKNQRGAYVGSYNDSLATVDFKSASDSISTELVKLLLPNEWFTVLDAARSKAFTLSKDGPYHKSSKFSTMGNGFTFELESLIFLCLGLACCEYLNIDDSGVSIFGDDLIVPVECETVLTAMCSFLGFTINKEKSFFSGLFRESCGSYYFAGQDVKPIFLKKGISRVKDVYRMANSICNLASRYNSRCGRDTRFRRVWSLCIHLLPSECRLVGPVSAGDAAIHVDFSEVHAPRHPQGWCGFTYTGLVERPLGHEKDSLGLLLSRLHSPSRSESWKNFLSYRSRTKTVLKRNMFCAQWYELGPWH